jgi:ubiquinone/menaquinone biosynthesis C-methylase UbiE
MGIYQTAILPRLMDIAMRGPMFAEQRRVVLAAAAGDVLEIGFGTGLNLPHYPSAVRSITTVDPNVGMSALAQRRIAASPIPVTPHTLSGERLPFADNSFDSVVSTWTLCSIPDVEQALAEIFRVLKPGGRFCFVEHGLAPDPNVQRWQRRLTPIQRVIADGCHLDRPIDHLVATQPFAMLRHDHFYALPSSKVASYFYRGVAEKPR